MQILYISSRILLRISQKVNYSLEGDKQPVTLDF